MASYRTALRWMALNDDCDWVKEGEPDAGLSVTAALVADLFHKQDAVVKRDLARMIETVEAEKVADKARVP